MSETLEGEYKGNPMFIIRQDERDHFPFQFGLKKARLLLEHWNEIKAFVTKHEEAGR